MAKERTLVMIKPRGIERKFVDKIIERKDFLKNLKIVRNNEDENMEEEDLRALLAEQRSLANEYHTSIWRSSRFFSALITALLGLSAILIGANAPKVLIVAFPFLALLFSIFGMFVLYRGSRYFLQATYAISVIRHKLDIHNSINKEKLKIYGIDDLLFERFPSAEEYVKERSIDLTKFRIRTIIYWIYIVLASMSIAFMGYVIVYVT